MAETAANESPQEARSFSDASGLQKSYSVSNAERANARLLLKTTRPTQEEFLHIGRVAILRIGRPFTGLPVRL